MNSVAEQTRAIYHEQHKRMANDDRAMERWTNMFSTDYFGVASKYFEGKKALDAGCGNTAKVPIALYKMGCRDIHAFDLGEAFIPTAATSAERQGVPAGVIKFKGGDVTKIPFEDNEFDFVTCHGVLVCLVDQPMVSKGFSELARVTKKGGMLYTVYGAVGGAFEGDGKDTGALTGLRKHYQTDRKFKEFIDNIKPSDFSAIFDIVTRGLKYHEGVEIPQHWKDWVADKFDTELCVMIQNVLQCPVRLRIDEETIRRMYRENGFHPPRRLKRYVVRKNVRQFMSPMHFEYENPLSQIIYGSGNHEFIAEKMN